MGLSQPKPNIEMQTPSTRDKQVHNSVFFTPPLKAYRLRRDRSRLDVESRCRWRYQGGYRPWRRLAPGRNDAITVLDHLNSTLAGSGPVAMIWTPPVDCDESPVDRTIRTYDNVKWARQAPITSLRRFDLKSFAIKIYLVHRFLRTVPAFGSETSGWNRAVQLDRPSPPPINVEPFAPPVARRKHVMKELINIFFYLPGGGGKKKKKKISRGVVIRLPVIKRR